MRRPKTLVAGAALALVLGGFTTVGATGWHNGNNGHNDCKEDKEIVWNWDKEQNEEYKGKGEYQGQGDHGDKDHRKPKHEKCDDKPEVCEYNHKLYKKHPRCVKPEEPKQPETPTVPETPQQPTPPTPPVVPPAPQVDTSAVTTTVVEVPVQEVQGK